MAPKGQLEVLRLDGCELGDLVELQFYKPYKSKWISEIVETKNDEVTTVKLAITYELPKMIARFMEENILGKMVTKELQANIDRFKELVEKKYKEDLSN